MVVGFGRKFIAAAGSSASQHFATVCSGHAGSESMDAQASANLGLVSTFGAHSKNPFKFPG